MAVYDFMKVKDEFLNYLKQSQDIVVLQDMFVKQEGSGTEKKGALDQAFREGLKELLCSDVDIALYKDLVNLAIVSVKEDLCSSSTPFMMLSDIFDVMSLERCSELFVFIEDNVAIWKSETFYNAGKNYLLRMCNDLLRRISRSQNTIFCGRIQLFLAILFPLTEKSGLNLTSEFHLENVTNYNKDAEDPKLLLNKSRDENMEVEEGEEMDDGSLLADYNMYRKFWSLQDYFRKPTQCYDKVAWKTFSNYADEVLRAFASYKLDDGKSAKRKLEEPHTDSHTYFAKYLTSEKLFDLQLGDGSFRRYILVQFLITFQYLTASVKFKQPHMTISDDQTKWIKETTERVYSLLKETPPNGEKFIETIQHILQREENWNNWKNSGCPSYIREPDEKEVKPKSVRPRKRSIGEDIKASGGKLIKMGSAELTRLWNLNPDNMDACNASKRVFLPTLGDFFQDAILEADPDQQVEEQYKHVNQNNFSWRALRLLHRRSPYAFAANNTAPFMTTPKYLESTVLKIAKDSKPDQASAATTDIKQENEDNEMEEGELKDDETEELPPMEGAKEEAVVKVTDIQIDSLAERLGADWKKLATELNFSQDEIDYWESETQDTKEQTQRMLRVWAEMNGDGATPAALQLALQEIGLVSIATDVLGEIQT